MWGFFFSSFKVGKQYHPGHQKEKNWGKKQTNKSKALKVQVRTLVSKENQKTLAVTALNSTCTGKVARPLGTGRAVKTLH